VNSPDDALDEAGHRDGHLFLESPIQYPELVLELFIPGPLQEKRQEKKT
jgi:hypothetical protein